MSTSNIIADVIFSNSVYTNSLNGAFPVSSLSGSLIQSGVETQNTSVGLVTFPIPYLSIPIVVATINSNSTTQLFQVQLSSITTTGFNFTKLLLETGGTIVSANTETFNWIAIGSV